MKKSVKTLPKPYWNFILDAMMMLCMSAIIGIGFLIKYTLISGLERKEVYGQNIDLYLLNMNRHQWGTLHLILGFIFFGLLIIHIFLHWKIVKNVYQKIIKEQLTKRIIAVCFILICALLILIPLLIKPDIVPITKGKEHKVTLVTDCNTTLIYFCPIKL